MRSILAWLNRLEELALTVTLLVLAVIAFAQVGSRYLLGISFDWFEEGGRFVGVFITFLGASIGAKRGAHFSMDALVGALSPGKARVLRVAVAVFSGCVFALVAWYGFRIVGRAHRFGSTSAALGVPMYLVYLTIPVLSISIAVRFFLTSIGLLRAQPAAGGK